MTQPEHYNGDAVRALLEGKNAELDRMHHDVRIGNLQGSRIVAVRKVLNRWAPEPGSPLAELWQQVYDATELYADDIARIVAATAQPIDGIDTGEQP
ncbi:hypothetical protein [Streptomyces zaomyceticus]|uniref:hypothetical protein n=1 Tax=Streptomyces zaomyceticus TaxID=68286 RepID=UPI002E0FD01A|nr:hypothetical protein OG237_06390 [Streptomyces zaomyceticus]